MNSKSCLDHIFKDKELKNACEFMCNGKSVAASVVMFPPPFKKLRRIVEQIIGKPESWKACCLLRPNL